MFVWSIFIFLVDLVEYLVINLKGKVLIMRLFFCCLEKEFVDWIIEKVGGNWVYESFGMELVLVDYFGFLLEES